MQHKLHTMYTHIYFTCIESERGFLRTVGWSRLCGYHTDRCFYTHLVERSFEIPSAFLQCPSILYNHTAIPPKNIQITEPKADPGCHDASFLGAGNSPTCLIVPVIEHFYEGCQWDVNSVRLWSIITGACPEREYRKQFVTPINNAFLCQ